jgi:serine/threonine-protein kinase
VNGRDWETTDNVSREDAWVGQVLAERYRVDARIGHGGMGIVYRGTHLELGKRVAIKRLDVRLTTEPAAFERFRNEAIAASRINSPYVVQVFDWGKAKDDCPFIVMELLEGQSLRHLFEQEGRLLALEAATITTQVLKGLQRIHQARVLHRDLKPENVFLCQYDEAAPFVKLLDFGISKQLYPLAGQSHVTESGMVLGTAAYMSPEQAKGDKELDIRSDLYSLGAVLYEALTGTAPHRGNTYAAMLVDICTRDADDVRLHCPLIPEALADVVKRALMRDRELRFTSAVEFLEALLDAMPVLRVEHDSGRGSQKTDIAASFGTDSTVVAPEVASRPRSEASPHRQRYAIWFMVGLVTTAALGLLTYRVTRPIPPNRAQSPSSATLTAISPTKRTVVSTVNPEPTTTTSPPVVGTANASVHPAVTLPTPARKPNRSEPSSRTQPSNSGVAGGLKLRRTMP